MNITFRLTVPERVTTGATERGRPAAESVDQVRVMDREHINRHLQMARSPLTFVCLHVLIRQVTSPDSSSAPSITRPTPTTCAHLCQDLRATEHATPRPVQRAAGK